MTGFIRLNGVPTARWTPFASHVRNAAEIERALGTLAAQVCGNEAVATAELRADVRETAAAYVVQIDVPGVAKEDIVVDVDEKSLRIEVAFKRETIEGETQVLGERASGSATRAFRLPPVSYTHLDVYKRQFSNFRQIRYVPAAPLPEVVDL